MQCQRERRSFLEVVERELNFHLQTNGGGNSRRWKRYEVQFRWFNRHIHFLFCTQWIKETIDNYQKFVYYIYYIYDIDGRTRLFISNFRGFGVFSLNSAWFLKFFYRHFICHSLSSLCQKMGSSIPRKSHRREQDKFEISNDFRWKKWYRHPVID